MLAAFKENVLPFMVYLTVLIATLVGIFRNPRVPLVLLVFLVSLPSFWYPTHRFPLGKDTMDLLFWGIMFGTIRAKEFRWPRYTWLLMVTILFTYVGVWHVSIRFGLPAPVTTQNPVLADWKNFSMLLLFSVASYSAIRTPEHAKLVVRVMIGVLLFMCWREIAGFAAGNSFSYTRRAEGPFWIAGLNPNHFGAFIAQMSLLALGVAAYLQNRRRRWICWGAAAVALYPLLYSYSRGAYAGFLVGLLAMGLLRYRWLIPMALLLAGLWQTVLPESVVDRITMTETEDGELEESAALRLVMWDIAKKLYAESPVFGIGFNGFFFETEGMNLRNVHNYYFQIAAEQGVVGVALLAGLLLLGLINGWRLWRMAQGTPFSRGVGLGMIGYTLAVIVVNVFGDRFSQLAMGGFYFMLIGLCAALRTMQSPVVAEAPMGLGDRAVRSDLQMMAPATPGLKRL